MNAIWSDPEPVEVPSSLRREVGGHRLLAELLVRRGLTTTEAARSFLDPRHYVTSAPSELPDMPRAVDRLVRALERQESVVVWGDFDVDGQTATAILMSALTEFGFKVSSYIPHRLEESHGLNEQALESQMARGVDLVVTCDCGTSDVAELEYCRRRGLDVIVTDHHDLVGQKIAMPICVNPRRLPVGHPLHNLSGAGVAFKTAQALYEHYRKAHRADRLLDLAALGTVADIVPLVAENRYIVQRGLPMLANGRRLGIETLARMGEVHFDASAPLDTYPVSFELAPLLNAAGRLAHADLGVSLLMTSDKAEAERVAGEVITLNVERRYQTSLTEKMARDVIEAMPHPLPSVLVLAHQEWHPGITGIVAGRLTEVYRRPVVLLALSDNGLGRASARSVPGVDVHAAILAQGDLLLAQGGHPMAAGFSIRAQDLEEFRRRLVDTVDDLVQDQVSRQALAIDAWVEWIDLSMELSDDLARMAPFGEGNRAPVLATRNLRLDAIQPIGERGSDFKLRLVDPDGLAQEVIWWRGSADLVPHGPMDAAYTLRADSYGGKRRLQVTLVDMRRTPAATLTIADEWHDLEVVDRRKTGDPRAELRSWLERANDGESVTCWGEGRALKETAGLRRRNQLRSAHTLVVWSTPPGPEEYRLALRTSGASRIVLIFGHTPDPTPVGFVRDLLGAVKYSVDFNDRWATLDGLAGALAQRQGTVLVGLQLLKARLGLRFTQVGSEGVIFDPLCIEKVRLGDIVEHPDARELKSALREAAAYRRFLLQAEPAQALPAGYRLLAAQE